MSGFRLDTEAWLREYADAKQLAQEVLQLIQDRNVNNAAGGSEASRKTATARRKMGTLGTLIEKLLGQLESPELRTLSESERNRRRDLLYDLRNRREQMQGSLKRNPGQSDRDQLLSGSQQGGAGSTSRETEATAELDTEGIMSMQRQMMRTQDEALDQVEKTVKSTKHIALAINDELGLQTRLLDELEEEVDVHQSRLQATTAKVKQLMRQTSHWKGGLCIFVLIVALVLTILLATKIARIFAH